MASAPLVPGNDPSLLFTSAGMVPFKDVFLGYEKPPADSAVSAQKCLRAGGKHNDLDNVGYTARHHTFFEMLGNFSFGAYFKEQAIALAWEFLTDTVGFQADRLLVSIHHSDEESGTIWRQQIGVPDERILRLGDVDNFWSMGDTGPCGPCTEIYYDHGADIAGGLPGSEDEGDRWVEIWNLVFMQYERAADGSQKPLPRPCVDTGMGLERLTAAAQGQVSNYDTDLFVPLIAHIAERLRYSGDLRGAEAASLRVVADHLRALCFMLAEGILPANEGRGYVLRRILRRAARHGHKLGATEPFVHLLVPFLAAQFGDAYPELTQNERRIATAIEAEEEQFGQALDRGMRMLAEHLRQHPGQDLPGELVFKLHDTYGFPVDMTADFAREHGLHWDRPGYEAAMAGQRDRARAAGTFRSERTEGLSELAGTEFSGYQRLADAGRILALWQGDESVPALAAGQEGRLALDRSPFYAEAGGQIGDSGELLGAAGKAQVLDCRPEGPVHLHDVAVREGQLQVGDSVDLSVDAERRAGIMRNHSATHLLHAALKQVLGGDIEQRGSWVGAERLRFDFSHPRKVSAEEQRRVSDLVCAQIFANSEVGTRVMGREEAMAAGAVALFGEKYGDEVRVLNMGGEFSVELCGGTHVARTGDIGLFCILSESSVSAGVRRIEAVTGRAALDWYSERASVLAEVAAQLRCKPEEAADRLAAQWRKLSGKEGGAGNAQNAQGAQMVGEDERQMGSVLVRLTRLSGVDSIKELQQARHALAKTHSGEMAAVQLLAAAAPDGQALVLVLVAEAVQEALGADEILRFVNEQTGGKGGGKKDFAQAGGGDGGQLEGLWQKLDPWLQERLG